MKPHLVREYTVSKNEIRTLLYEIRKRSRKGEKELYVFCLFVFLQERNIQPVG